MAPSYYNTQKDEHVSITRENFPVLETLLYCFHNSRLVSVFYKQSESTCAKKGGKIRVVPQIMGFSTEGNFPDKQAQVRVFSFPGKKVWHQDLCFVLIRQHVRHNIKSLRSEPKQVAGDSRRSLMSSSLPLRGNTFVLARACSISRISSTDLSPAMTALLTRSCLLSSDPQ